MSEERPDHRRSVRSYVLRAGRTTASQSRAREELWPRYGIDAGPGVLDLPAVFGRAAPVTMEIGFGNGDQLVSLAHRHPELDFLGVEVHPPGVGHVLNMAAAGDLGNLRVMQHDAMRVLRECIGPATLDCVLVLFPDPWPKKRHHKRRLVNAEFAALIASRLVPGGTLQLATDWVPYAEWMLEVLAVEPGLRNCAPGGAYGPRHPDRVRTRFEARGERLGHEVRELCFERISPAANAGSPA